MKRSTFFVLLVLLAAELFPSHAGAVTFQQTTVTTSTVEQTNVTSGGSIFNPFPLVGGSAPLATSPTTFNPSPVVGSAPPTPATGISVFDPFPLTGGAAPLAAPVQPFTSTTVGASASFFPSSAGGASRSGTSTTTVTTSSTSSSAPMIQTTVTTTIPLSLALTTPSSTTMSSSTVAPSSTGVALALTATEDPVSTGRLVQNPEPSTLILFGSGFAALAWYDRKRRRVVKTED